MEKKSKGGKRGVEKKEEGGGGSVKEEERGQRGGRRSVRRLAESNPDEFPWRDTWSEFGATSLRPSMGESPE